MEQAAERQAQLLAKSNELLREHSAVQAAREADVQRLLKENVALKAAQSPGALRRAEFDLCLENARRCLDIDEPDAAEEQLRQASALLPAEASLFDVRALVAAYRRDEPSRLANMEKAWRLDRTPERGLSLAQARPLEDALAILGSLDRAHPQRNDVALAFALRLLETSGGDEAAAAVLIGRTADAQSLNALADQVLRRAGRSEPAIQMEHRVNEVLASRRRVADEARAQEALQRAELASKRRQDSENARRIEEERIREAAEYQAILDTKARKERHQLDAKLEQQRQAHKDAANHDARIEARLPYLVLLSAVPGLIGGAFVPTIADADQGTLAVVVFGAPLVFFLLGALFAAFGVVKIPDDAGKQVLVGLVGAEVGSVIFLGCLGPILEWALDLGEATWFEPTMAGTAWVICGLGGAAAGMGKLGGP